MSVPGADALPVLVMHHPVNKIAYAATMGRKVAFLTKRPSEGVCHSYKCHMFVLAKEKEAISLVMALRSACNSVLRKVGRTGFQAIEPWVRLGAARGLSICQSLRLLVQGLQSIPPPASAMFTCTVRVLTVVRADCRSLLIPPPPPPSWTTAQGHEARPGEEAQGQGQGSRPGLCRGRRAKGGRRPAAGGAKGPAGHGGGV